MDVLYYPLADITCSKTKHMGNIDCDLTHPKEKHYRKKTEKRGPLRPNLTTKRKRKSFLQFYTFDYHYSFCSISKCSLFEIYRMCLSNLVWIHNFNQLGSHKVPTPANYQLVWCKLIDAHPRFSRCRNIYNWRNLMCYYNY